MDHFGIGAALDGVSRLYFMNARRSGRTTSLVNSVKDGDRIVFLNHREGERVKQLCKDRGVDIEVIACSPKHPERLFDRPTPSGNERTLFDHTWLEEFYLDQLQRATEEVDHLQRSLSGRSSKPEQPTHRRSDWDTMF